MKKCFIICWFGVLPEYFPAWAKSCEYNQDFNFLIFTDNEIKYKLPKNVFFHHLDKTEFLKRCKFLGAKISLDKPYRLCDFRPMYGEIFKDELKQYDFWGYCDIDLIFGDINKYIQSTDFESYEAIFNGGHFTLIRNNAKMNSLFKAKGAIFDYKTVIKREAIYAFDETTGFQRIARTNGVYAKFGIPYVETESKYKQLRSRLEKENPDNQCFYWDNGKLYRAKEEKGEVYYQELAYIHLQKRKLILKDLDFDNSTSFWILPDGFMIKEYSGIPSVEDIHRMNPNDGIEARNKEEKIYKRNKMIAILKRNPFQIYVRLKQQFAGINANDGSKEAMEWIKY